MPLLPLIKAGKKVFQVFWIKSGPVIGDGQLHLSGTRLHCLSDRSRIWVHKAEIGVDIFFERHEETPVTTSGKDGYSQKDEVYGFPHPQCVVQRSPLTYGYLQIHPLEEMMI